ncbi:MAG: hypothetical protein J7K54_00865 [Candidatus Aenigmarchaeota archaeon]|nr:hypothetical protein [Candidatus Aenigmarchaeota archaeon]
MNKLTLFIFTLGAMFLLSGSSAYAAYPNPGHPADEIGSGTFNGTGSDVWSFPGRVGIGTASPAYPLDVSGNARVSNDLQVGGSITAGAGEDICISGGQCLSNAENKVDDVWVNETGDTMRGILNMGNNRIINIGNQNTDFTTGGGLTLAGQLSVNNNAQISNNLNVDSNTLFVDSANNRVGIGTPAPSYNLDVNGIARIGTRLVVDSSNPIFVDYDGPYYGVSIPASATGGWSRSFNFRDSSDSILGAFGGYGGVNALTYLWFGRTYTDTDMVIRSGNVGIGTDAPKNKLDVEGGAVIGATYSGSNTAPNNGLLVEGNVGIGTASTNAKLDVNGVSQASTVGIRSDGSSDILLVQANSGDNMLKLSGDPNEEATLFSVGDLDDVGKSVRFTLDENNAKFYFEGGNVGIGTTAPAEKMEVAGNLKLSMEGADARLILSSDDGGEQGKTYLFNKNGVGFVIQDVGGFDLLRLEDSDGNDKLVVNNDGNVGIGTDAPKNKLDVAGGVVIGATYSGTNTAPSNGLLVEGSVGIGTRSPSPSAKLDVAGDSIFGGTLHITNDIDFGNENGCSGSAKSCYSFNSDSDFVGCDNQLGCTPTCSGSIDCSVFSYQWQCDQYRDLGCNWAYDYSYGGYTCTGYISCETMYDEYGYYCGHYDGCYLSCEGTATPCADLTSSNCNDQDGCSLSTIERKISGDKLGIKTPEVHAPAYCDEGGNNCVQVQDIDAINAVDSHYWSDADVMRDNEIVTCPPGYYLYNVYTSKDPNHGVRLNGRCRKLPIG